MDDSEGAVVKKMHRLLKLENVHLASHPGLPQYQVNVTRTLGKVTPKRWILLCSIAREGAGPATTHNRDSLPTGKVNRLAPS